MEEPTAAMNDNATRFELDERQRAMLAEMGVRVWMPKTAPVVPPVAKEVAASPSKDISTAPPLLSVPIVDVTNLPTGIANMDWPQLQSAVTACTSCGLSQSRQQAILGDGLVSANWMITINLDKAKDITKQRLRAEREPLLAAQDVAFQRALESNADTAAIVAEKQRLRDVTALVDTCSTLDELKAIEVTP